MRNILLLAALPLAFAACASKSPVADVVAAEAALAASGRIVIACYAVPACNTVAPKDKIKLAFDTAYDAVTAAQATADAGGSPSMTAASAALAALQDIVTKLPKTGA